MSVVWVGVLMVKTNLVFLNMDKYRSLSSGVPTLITYTVLSTCNNNIFPGPLYVHDCK